MSRTQTFKWFPKFKCSRDSVEGEHSKIIFLALMFIVSSSSNTYKMYRLKHENTNVKCGMVVLPIVCFKV
jgi:hypothetical protein